MNRSTMRSRVVLRLVAGALLLIGLGGPSPGYVGGCDSGPRTADPFQFCVSKETYVCARECAVGRYTPEMCSALCGSNDAIVGRCAGFNWIPGCAPSESQTGVCIDALADSSRIGTPSNEIIECQNLCAGAGLTADEGI